MSDDGDLLSIAAGPTQAEAALLDRLRSLQMYALLIVLFASVLTVANVTMVCVAVPMMVVASFR
ncbi:MAG TPA: hypothetical protein VKD22_00685 [Ramlibacter sp.]|jgi:hypothetical protein|nr:hypothetical protein [Ramlibacter sp.]